MVCLESDINITYFIRSSKEYTSTRIAKYFCDAGAAVLRGHHSNDNCGLISRLAYARSAQQNERYHAACVSCNSSHCSINRK